MSILVTCACGKQTRVPAGMAGKQMRCLSCQRLLVAAGTVSPQPKKAPGGKSRRAILVTCLLALQTNPNSAFMELLVQWEQHLGTGGKGGGNGP